MSTLYIRREDYLEAEGQVPSYKGYQTPSPPTANLYPELNSLPPRAIITKKVHKHTIKLLEQAANIAEAIQGPKIPSSKTYGDQSSFFRSGSTPRSNDKRRISNGIVYIDCSSREYNVLSSKTVHNTTVNHGNNKREEKKDNTVTFVLAAIVGFIGLIGGAFYLAKSQSKSESLEREIEKFAKSEKKWNYNRQAYAYSPEYEKRANKIIELTRRIMQRNRSSLSNSIYKVALPILASSGLLLAGALFTNIPIIVGGILGLGALASYAVYKGVKNAYSDANQIDADKILKNMEKLEKTELHQEANAFFATEW